METKVINTNSPIKTEEKEYRNEKDSYIITMSYNSESIMINIKNSKPYQYSQFEKKFNYSELKQMNLFFYQFPNAEKIENLFANLLDKKKVEIQETQNLINFSFMNMLEEKITLKIPKKEYKENEKIDKFSEIVNKLIIDVEILKNENKLIKDENKELKEKIEELVQFKIKIEEKEKQKQKYNNLKNSSILHKDKVKMISNWIMPNKNIIYSQIYKATRDGGTGKDFHRYCDNKKATLTLIESTNGYIFGGYITIPWDSTSSWEYRANDNEAFIFSITNNLKYPIKNKNKVIYNHKDYGPDFGMNNIYIDKEFFNGSNQSWNDDAYNSSSEKIAGGKFFKVKELEVYLVEIE